jgi:hypothetical protein
MKALSSIESVNDLIINGCSISDFSILKGKKISKLSINKGKFEKLRGVEALGLSHLEVGACRKMIEIESKDFLNLKSLWITACNKIELSRLKNNIHCKQMRLMSRTQDFFIEDLLQIDGLEEIICTNLQASIGIDSLSSYNSCLKSVYLAPFSSKTLKSLRVKFPDVQWKT